MGFKVIIASFVLSCLISTFVLAAAGYSAEPTEESDPKAFEILKEKSIDPRTGLPKTMDPNLFRGKAKEAYQVAKEIPEVLAQMPCFCGCETYGHENLLDCFVDRHGDG